MNIWKLIFSIGFLGAIGGIVNSAVTGEFALPALDSENGIWRPGWIGNVLVGIVAAIIIAAMYGPIAQYDLIKNEGIPPSIRLSEIMGAVVVGMGGGNILTQLSKNNAERVSRADLANLSLSLIEELDKLKSSEDE